MSHLKAVSSLTDSFFPHQPCESCGRLCTDDELGECLTCGERSCGIRSDCTGECACDRNLYRDLWPGAPRFAG